MKYRGVQQKSTGLWLDVLFTTEADKFSVTKASHKRDIARGWSIAQADLDVVDADSDPRSGALIPGPVVFVPPTPRELYGLATTIPEQLGVIAEELGLK